MRGVLFKQKLVIHRVRWVAKSLPLLIINSVDVFTRGADRRRRRWYTGRNSENLGARRQDPAPRRWDDKLSSWPRDIASDLVCLPNRKPVEYFNRRTTPVRHVPTALSFAIHRFIGCCTQTAVAVISSHEMIANIWWSLIYAEKFFHNWHNLVFIKSELWFTFRKVI